MQTHIEFSSDAFPHYPGEDLETNPGRHGKRLAEFLSAHLPAHGISVENIQPESWGWVVNIQNERFPLWIGCGAYEEFENGFLCFIEPSKPFLRKWLKKIDTTQAVSNLGLALETVLRQAPNVEKLRWWTDNG